MIASLAGIVIEKEENRVILEVAGIGYEVFLPTHTFLKVQQGESVKLFVVHVVKEDAEELFGFADSSSRSFFRTLINISGVGPRTALQVMSIGSTSEIQAAIDAGDVTRLTSIPGIGSKTAQKIILELRGKLAILEEATKDADILEALVGMGYVRKDAHDALVSLSEDLTEEQRLREALRRLKR